MKVYPDILQNVSTGKAYQNDSLSIFDRRMVRRKSILKQ
jgi:hypothetical protein